MIPDDQVKQGRKFDYIQKLNPYENIEFYSPDDKLMFYADTKKVDWYLKRGLIKYIGDKKYKFLFEPKGKGHADETSTMAMPPMKKDNICVVTGKYSQLTRHHIVPNAYIKYFLFPDYSANRLQHHDLVLITNSAHEEYERKALILKDKLCKKYDIMSFDEACKIQAKTYNAASHGKKLLDIEYAENNRYYKKELNEYCSRYNIEPDQLMFFVHEKKKDVDQLNCHYKELSEKLVTLEMLQEFCEIWRQHFLTTMKPKYMPEGWAVKTKISPALS